MSTITADEGDRVTLIGEILGVLLGGAVVGSYVRSPVGRVAGVALAVVAIAALLFFDNAAGLVKAFPTSIRANEQLSSAAVQNVPAAAAGVASNNPFLDWARNRMTAAHGGLTYWLPPIADPFNAQWVSYALLPGVLQTNQHDADWLIFYGINPSQVAYDRSAFKPPIYYQPGYAIAERLDAR
jgi:hypothetical protein